MGSWMWPPVRDTGQDAISGTTLELWLTCGRLGTDRNDLFSVYPLGPEEEFTIEQFSTDLIIGATLREDGRQTKLRHLRANGLFNSGVSRFITVATSKQGTTIYAEGLAKKTFPGLEIVPENFRGRVLLGQTARAHQEWFGIIRGLGFYRRALSAGEVFDHYQAWRQGNWLELMKCSPAALYPFNEGGGGLIRNRAETGGDLVIPRTLDPMRPELLARPNREGLRDTTDILLNILGFVPFGALLFSYLSNLGWKGPLAGLGAVVTGFSISFTIEVLQVLLPSRHSSLLDLINNSIGTALGAWLGFLILSRSAKAGRLRADL